MNEQIGIICVPCGFHSHVAGILDYDSTTEVLFLSCGKTVTREEIRQWGTEHWSSELHEKIRRGRAESQESLENRDWDVIKEARDAYDSNLINLVEEEEETGSNKHFPTNAPSDGPMDLTKDPPDFEEVFPELSEKLDDERRTQVGTAASESDEDGNIEMRIRHDIERISGVGKNKAKALRNAGYGSIDEIMLASQDELAEVEGIGMALAARIKADVGNRDKYNENESMNESDTWTVGSDEEDDGDFWCEDCESSFDEIGAHKEKHDKSFAYGFREDYQ